MDFYRINEEYNRFLQRYEKEKRGVTKVPNYLLFTNITITAFNFAVFPILPTSIFPNAGCQERQF